MNDYNLLDEKWIPVLDHNGRVKRVNTLEALKDASGIRCVTLASPLDLFAVHRFILTLLYWKADLAGGMEHVRHLLLNGQGAPRKILDGIRSEAHCFDLFDDQSPFLQDRDVRDAKKENRKSVGSLFAECATGTNIAHFHHGDDENMRLCLPCVTLGMLRVVPWSQSGGSGLTPSVHNEPPIMAIAIGNDLATTLGLNLVPMDAKAGQANWSGHFAPTDPAKPIPYLEALIWNPRRIFVPLAEKGACWHCGQRGVPTVGKIVYMKNENTKLLEQKGKKIQFHWLDPSAFYLEGEWATTKSSREELAMSSRDLNRFLGDRATPKCAVVSENPKHECWSLVIPCTDRMKTFDHRQLELASFSPETVRSLLPPDVPPIKQHLNGWEYPKVLRATAGIRLFVQAAAELLNDADWAVLGNAAYRDMHDSPAAFDLLSGLYWGLRHRNIQGLPKRNVAWLMLKLMAAVPAHDRRLLANAAFSPLQLLPQRQVKENGRASPYPVSLPRGPRLEAALRDKIDRNMHKRHPEPVDWIGLCCALNQLLD